MNKIICVIMGMLLLTNNVYAKINMIEGQRFGIQVASETEPTEAYKVYPIYRPYALPFLYKTKIKVCTKQPQECKMEKRYRVIIGLYKTKKEASDKLKEFKTQNAKDFKNAFVQVVVE